MLPTLIKSHAQHLPATLEELGTNPDELKKDIASLREWYSYQKHLPQDLGDTVLGSFLVGSKNSIEIAKMKLDMYYSERRRYADIYGDCDPTGHELVKSYKTVFTVTLPVLTPDGSSVNILKLRNPDPSLYSPMDPVKRLNMLFELTLHKMIMNAKSYVIYDYEHCTNAHMTKINPLLLKAHIEVLKFLPVRVKGVIAINCPKFAEKTYNIIRNFMSEKLKQRLYIYTEGTSVLSKHVPVDILPKDYGGTGEYTLEELNDYWHDRLVENQAWFVDERQHNSDESKRPTDSKYRPEAAFGVDGSFKKLSID